MAIQLCSTASAGNYLFIKDIAQEPRANVRRDGDFGNFCHLVQPFSMPDNGRFLRDDERNLQPSNKDGVVCPDPPTLGEESYYDAVASSGDKSQAIYARCDAPNLGEGGKDHGVLGQASAVYNSHQYKESGDLFPD